DPDVTETDRVPAHAAGAGRDELDSPTSRRPRAANAAAKRAGFRNRCRSSAGCVTNTAASPRGLTQTDTCAGAIVSIIGHIRLADAPAVPHGPASGRGPA